MSTRFFAHAGSAVRPVCGSVCLCAVFSLSLSATELTQTPSVLAPEPTQRLDLTHWLATQEAGRWGVSFGLASAFSTRSQVHPAHPHYGATLWEPTVGLHWRTSLGQGRHLDVSTWAHLPYSTPQPYTSDLIWRNHQNNYATQVEVQWRSPRFGGIFPEFGAIGVKLEGQGQLLLRARSGGAMLYYRTKF